MVQAENNTDFVKLGIAALIMSIAVSVLMGFAAYAGESRHASVSIAGTTSANTWTEVMETESISGIPTPVQLKNYGNTTKAGCAPGETGCTTGIGSESGTSANFITDIISTLVSLAKAVAFIVQAIGLTLLAPIVVGTAIVSVAQGNPWIIYITVVTCGLWQIVQAWLLWRLFMTKRA